MAERNMSSMKKRGKGKRMLLSLVNEERLVKILQRMLDENEFLSEYGIRSYVLTFMPPTLKVTNLDFRNIIKTTLMPWKYMAKSLRSLMYLETLTAAYSVEIVIGEVYVMFKTPAPTRHC